MKVEKTITKIVEIKVAEYVKDYNEKHEKPINRNDVYKMIKEGKLDAYKAKHGAWIIKLPIEEKVWVDETEAEELDDLKKKKCPSSKKNGKKDKKMAVKKFVEKYNEKHPKYTITVPEARKLIEDGALKGEKVAGRWYVTSSPSRRIK